MKKGLVSIMIPTYNRPVLFEMTLISALSQDYPKTEILVCDNSTNDDTERRVQKYLTDSRLTYRRNRDAKTKAENFAPFEQMAQGEYLQWLMDDDILAPDKLSKMVEVFNKHKNVALVTNQRLVIDINNDPINQHKLPFPIKSPYSIYPAEFVAWLSLREAFNLFGEPPTYLFRRRDLTHHYWRADCKGMIVISDVAMALEVLEKGDIAIFREPLSFYRRHGGQEGQQVDTVLLSRLEWNELNKDYLARQVFPYTETDYLTLLQKLVVEYDERFYKLEKRASAEMWARYTAFIDEVRSKI